MLCCVDAIEKEGVKVDVEIQSRAESLHEDDGSRFAAIVAEISRTPAVEREDGPDEDAADVAA